MVKRFDVYLVSLNPTVGTEIKKTRPGVIISPNEMNEHLGMVIIAPMTTKKHPFPTRVDITFKDKSGQVVLDQIRTIDKTRLIKYLGKLTPSISTKVCTTLQEMFAA